MRPSLPKFSDVEPLLRSIDISRIYSNHGPLVTELESEYAKYFGIHPELVVAVGNATLALQGLVEILDVNNWYAPDYTFAATGLAIIKAAKNLHLCDVDLVSWKLDLSELDVDSDSIGVMPVMPFGAEIDLNDYVSFKNVVIDAAASLGRTPPDISKMPTGWSIVFSLHATKVLGAGEGSIVVCGNRELAENLRAWINFGFKNERISSLSGTNAKLSEFNAAYGLVSLRNFTQERDKWLEVQKWITDFMKNRSWSTFVNQEPAFQPYWIANFENEKNRSVIAAALTEVRIQSREWWARPLSKQPAFEKYSVKKSLSNSSYLASAHLGLPVYSEINREDIQLIIQTIDNAIEISGVEI
jgi:dTDP-4-amino-4,6-dideoxygalactose transaminase